MTVCAIFRVGNAANAAAARNISLHTAEQRNDSCGKNMAAEYSDISAETAASRGIRSLCPRTAEVRYSRIESIKKFRRNSISM